MAKIIAIVIATSTVIVTAIVIVIVIAALMLAVTILERLHMREGPSVLIFHRTCRIEDHDHR